MTTVKMTPLQAKVSIQDIQVVVDQIVAKFQPERVILFGSYAYGDPNPTSDVDLLVVMNTSLRSIEQELIIGRAINYRFGLDLLVHTPRSLTERIAKGDSFLHEIVTQGKVLYERPAG
jgi:predicted nucleotidyltransferase